MQNSMHNYPVNLVIKLLSKAFGVVMNSVYRDV
jgi:hypothetical protein